MTLNAFRRFSTKMLGAGFLVSAMFVAACGSTSTGVAAPTATVAKTCQVTAADLSTGTGGKSTAPKVDGVTGKLTISGSTALQPLFKAAQANFDAANGTVTTVNGGGSGQGLQDAESGASDIGMSDLFATEKDAKYADLKDHQVAAVAFTLVVSQDVSVMVHNLTTQQVKDIFSGTTTNWSQVGGPNENIQVVVRKAGSGTRFSFDKYVLGDAKGTNDAPANAILGDATNDLIAKVSAANGSIGYASTNFTSNPDAVKVLFPICIDGFSPTAANINSGDYKFWAYEHAYTKSDATGNAKAFLDYVSSDAFQNAEVPAQIFLQVKNLTDKAKQTHPAPSA